MEEWFCEQKFKLQSLNACLKTTPQQDISMKYSRGYMNMN